MQRRTTVAALLALALTLPAFAQPSRQHALLIGINDYTASRLNALEPIQPPARNIPNLDGAINDVELMHEVVQYSYGFKAADVTVLKDQQATRRAILDGLAGLAAAAKSDDSVLFYYSGHGSQVRNSFSAEEDKLDESIIPADSRRGAPDIRDKELQRWFNRILDRGARLTVVIDACHSGSLARGLAGGGSIRQVITDPRDVADPSTGPQPEDRGALVLSAARDHDPAFETNDDGLRGAFTWSLVRALRDFDRDEPISDTFTRARALLQTSHPGQEPVIAGLPSVRARPFLGNRIDRRERRPVIAIQKIQEDGTYLLEGGWMSGVTVGSELRFAQNPALRLEVTKLRGISLSEARALPLRGTGDRRPPARVSSRLAAGELLEITNWAPPPARPLRVWIPQGGERALRFAQELRNTAADRRIQWIDDPVETTPRQLLRWNGRGWELVAGLQGAGVLTVASLDDVACGTSLFVQLPIPEKVAQAVSDVDGIELTAGPDTADYILAGRLGARNADYAFVRPRASARDAERSPLPLRTAWMPETSAYALRDALTRLQRAHAWHDLQSPQGASAYYSLAICRKDDGVLVSDGILLGERVHHLVLRAGATPPEGVFTKFIYAFIIDSQGKSVLLFPAPRKGDVENRLPVTAAAAKPVVSPPPEISLDGDPFLVTAPYGVDTYFLLTTDEPLLALSSLEWDGVQGKHDVRGNSDPVPPKSPLERLLARTLSGRRGDPDQEPVRTPPNWSLEKVAFHSVAPGRATR
jgi:hypothetical protein